MNNNSIGTNEALKNLGAYAKRTVLIKVAYFLLGLIVSVKLFPIPWIVHVLIFLMVVYALIVYFIALKYVTKQESINNILFLLILLDLFLITIIIGFLGITLYIIYPFYIVLAFMTLPRHKAVYLLFCVVSLYLAVISFQYFRIFQPIQVFSPQDLTPQNFSYVSAMTSLYLITLLFLSLRCYDFYGIITRRINDLKKVYQILEEKKESLEIRILAKRKELREQKEGLEKKVKERKKELGNENRRLEERIIELEKFEKVALGREMKLEELKKEIKRIKR